MRNDIVSKNAKSWDRVSESIGDLAECFNEKIAQDRTDYVAITVLSQIVRFLHVFMASLDALDSNHINSSKEKRTGFNYRHIAPSRPKTKYNNIQNDFLDFLYDKTKTAVSFRTDEASSFAKTSASKNKLVIGALKSCKQVEYSEDGDSRHSISISPFDIINVKNNNLSNEEKRELKSYLQNSCKKILVFFEMLTKARNEEIHSSPVSVDIDIIKYLMISNGEKLNRLVQLESGGNLIARDSAFFLCGIDDNDLSKAIEKRYPATRLEVLRFRVDDSPKLHGYKQLAMPDNRMIISGTGTLNIRNTIISGNLNTGILLSTTSSINFKNVLFLFPGGDEIVVSSNSLEEVCKQLPSLSIEIPSITLSMDNETVNLVNIVETAIFIKNKIDEFLLERVNA
tara:strand:+ start:78 stop:1271 length:1194 start_codon:yes stop_codon:yes gene_type:complete